MKAVLVVTMAMLMAGCGVGSDVPLRAQAGERMDPRLQGAWRVERNDGLYYHIGATAEASKVVIVGHSDDGDVESREAELHAACLPSGCYITYGWESPEGKAYQIVRYEVMADGALAIQFDAGRHMENAIKQKRLKGTITRGLLDGMPFGPSTVHLQATEAELRDYLAKHGDEAFDKDTVVLRKITSAVESDAAGE